MYFCVRISAFDRMLANLVGYVLPAVPTYVNFHDLPDSNLCISCQLFTRMISGCSKSLLYEWSINIGFKPYLSPATALFGLSSTQYSPVSWNSANAESLSAPVPRIW